MMEIGEILHTCGIPSKLLSCKPLKRCTVTQRSSHWTVQTANKEVWNHCWCPSGGNSAPTLRRAVEGREEEPGFTLAPQGPVACRHPKEALADLYFADDTSLLTDAVRQAQELLLRVEEECALAALGLNGPMTKNLKYNIEDDTPLMILYSTWMQGRFQVPWLMGWQHR